MSIPFSLDKQDGVHILKVAGYSVGAAAVAAAISVLAKAQINPEWLFLVPFVNTGLVSLERYFLDQTK